MKILEIVFIPIATIIACMGIKRVVELFYNLQALKHNDKGTTRKFGLPF